MEGSTTEKLRLKYNRNDCDGLQKDGKGVWISMADTHFGCKVEGSAAHRWRRHVADE
jgi:hypothetical protein